MLHAATIKNYKRKNIQKNSANIHKDITYAGIRVCLKPCSRTSGFKETVQKMIIYFLPKSIELIIYLFFLELTFIPNVPLKY